MKLNQPIKYNVNIEVNCGYEYVVTDSTYKTLKEALKRFYELKKISDFNPTIIEIY